MSNQSEEAEKRNPNSDNRAWHLVRCRPPPTFRIEDSIACRTPHADCHLPITDSADLLAQPTALLALEFLTPAHRQRPSATCSPAGLN
jgi:hypothetical protein